MALKARTSRTPGRNSADATPGSLAARRHSHLAVALRVGIAGVEHDLARELRL